jgi:protease-4
MPPVRILMLFVRNVVVAFLALSQATFRKLFRTKPVEWVVYELSGRVGRGSPDSHTSFAWRAPHGPRISTLVQLERELALLRETPDVRGVLIKLRDVRCTAAVFRELRGLLRDFRASGREVVFHADSLDTREYWLASVGSRVWLMPRGRLDLIGFAASSSAAARPLKKLGVVFDVIRAGVFKSAGELFGAEKVSAEQQRQLDDLIGDLNDLFIGDVADGRGISREAVQKAVDAGPYSSVGAKAAGLVDDLFYADEVRAKLGRDGARARLGPFSAVLANKAPPADWRPLRDRRTRIAVVDIEGVIASGKSRAIPGMASTAGSETLVATLSRLRYADSVKAVVLNIDSRGGSALASDLIWRAAKRLAEVKPVVAYLDTVAASGGYYIAAAAREIWSAPTCITGSIGVFMLRPNASGVYEKLEVDRSTVRRGEHASIYQPDHSLTEDERDVLQRDVLQTYDDFIQTVAEGRHLPDARVRELAEGRVYLDSLGTLEQAVEAAARLAQVKGATRVQRLRSKQAGWREVIRTLRRGEGPDALLKMWFPKLDTIQALWTGEMPR